jgi:pyruvate dehydrogenase E2 component (dihydrolipoamide acetyltransferase)
MAEMTVVVPDIGGAEGAEVVEILVSVGDTIEVEQSLIVLESDKASMEIPSSAAGVVSALKVALGDALSEGDAILILETAEGVQTNATSTTPPPAETDSPLVTSNASNGPEDQTPVADHINGAQGSGVQEVPVSIPDIGTDGDVELIELCAAVGDYLNEGDSLVVLESDKASMEVPAPVSGELIAWHVEAGATVKQGVLIATLAVTGQGETVSGAASAATPDTLVSPQVTKETDESATQPADADRSSAMGASESQASSTPMAQPSGDTDSGNTSASVYAGPAVRKLAREFGIDLHQVQGSGPKGRILKDDLHSFVSQRLQQKSPVAEGGSAIPPVPDQDFAKFGAVEIVERSRLDKITAQNMHRNWLNVPHVTQFDDADITDLEAFRQQCKAESEKRGIKLTPMPFVLKACAVALNRHPKFKTSLLENGEKLVHKHYCHIGMAVDTPAGLVVPVIRDVDQKSIWQIAEDVMSLAALARDKKLKPDQMQGGVFSISSLGNMGGRGFTPIVNAPEVGILAVSRASMQPSWDGQQFVPRLMLPLSLSYDHRVINGGDAGRFLTDLVDLLGDLRKLLL